MRGIFVLIALWGATVSAQTPPASPDPIAHERPPVIKPVEILKCKPASSREEAKVREAAEAANFSDHEVLARLIFSETLASGYFAKECHAPSLEFLMEALGWVVINRVDRYSPNREDPKPDAIFHVVFAAKQFSPSFSSKSDNPFSKAFLCPFEGQKYLESVQSSNDGLDVYKQAKEVAARILDHYQHKGIAPQFSKIFNVFYPYSAFGAKTRPAWAKDPDPSKNKGYVKLIGEAKPCAEFYRR